MIKIALTAAVIFLLVGFVMIFSLLRSAGMEVPPPPGASAPHGWPQEPEDWR